MLSNRSPRLSLPVNLTLTVCVALLGCYGCKSNEQISPVATGGATNLAMGGTGTIIPTAPAAQGGATTGTQITAAVGGTTVKLTSSTGGTAATGGATAKGGASSVQTGGTSAGGTSATAASTVWRGPTPATATAKFPFPQNRQSANCIYPANYRNEDVQAIYTQWKKDVVVADGSNFRVQRPKEPGLDPNSSVSEGIAYGMIIAVYMNDQPLFDGLWKYWLSHTWTCVPSASQSCSNTQTTLMNWYILANGNPGSVSGQVSLGAATDADEDAAWALIMADRQWGGSGSLSKAYLQSAKDLLNDIWTYEIYQGKLPRNGSSWGDWNDLNISYFAPSHYRVFAAVTGKQEWISGVVATVYDTINKNLTAARKNQSNGLVPAWTRSDGGDISATDRPKNYQYDSCRTPFRIGLDACFNGDSLAIAYVAKTSSFFSGVGASKIVTGYNLDGTEKPEFTGQSSSFVGTAGVGAMHSANYQSFVDDVYGLIRQNNMNNGGLYYDESWAMMTILMMTGNYLDYTKY